MNAARTGSGGFAGRYPCGGGVAGPSWCCAAYWRRNLASSSARASAALRLFWSRSSCWRSLDKPGGKCTGQFFLRGSQCGPISTFPAAPQRLQMGEVEVPYPCSGCAAHVLLVVDDSEPRTDCLFVDFRTRQVAGHSSRLSEATRLDRKEYQKGKAVSRRSVPCVLRNRQISLPN